MARPLFFPKGPPHPLFNPGKREIKKSQKNSTLYVVVWRVFLTIVKALTPCPQPPIGTLQGAMARLLTTTSSPQILRGAGFRRGASVDGWILCGGCLHRVCADVGIGGRVSDPRSTEAHEKAMAARAPVSLSNPDAFAAVNPKTGLPAPGYQVMAHKPGTAIAASGVRLINPETPYTTVKGAPYCKLLVQLDASANDHAKGIVDTMTSIGKQVTATAKGGDVRSALTEDGTALFITVYGEAHVQMCRNMTADDVTGGKFDEPPVLVEQLAGDKPPFLLLNALLQESKAIQLVVNVSCSQSKKGAYYCNVTATQFRLFDNEECFAPDKILALAPAGSRDVTRIAEVVADKSQCRGKLGSMQVLNACATKEAWKAAEALTMYSEGMEQGKGGLTLNLKQPIVMGNLKARVWVDFENKYGPKTAPETENHKVEMMIEIGQASTIKPGCEDIGRNLMGISAEMLRLFKQDTAQYLGDYLLKDPKRSNVAEWVPKVEPFYTVDEGEAAGWDLCFLDGTPLPLSDDGYKGTMLRFKAPTDAYEDSTLSVAKLSIELTKLSNIYVVKEKFESVPVSDLEESHFERLQVYDATKCAQSFNAEVLGGVGKFRMYVKLDTSKKRKIKIEDANPKLRLDRVYLKMTGGSGAPSSKRAKTDCGFGSAW